MKQNQELTETNVGTPSVFLSHSSVDKPFARKLAQMLTKSGAHVWLDEAELKIGDSLLLKISTAIHKTDFVVAILSSTSTKSNWVQKELDIAMSSEISSNQVKVLPLVVDDCQIPPYLLGKLYLEFKNHDDFDSPFEILLNTIGIKSPSFLSPKFSNVRFYSESGYGNQAELDTSSTTFNFPISKIYAVWDFKYCHNGMKFTRKWYKDSLLIKNLVKNDVFDSIWISDSQTMSTFINNRKGHPRGEYTLRLYIEEEYICSAGFSIK